MITPLCISLFDEINRINGTKTVERFQDRLSTGSTGIVLTSYKEFLYAPTTAPSQIYN